MEERKIIITEKELTELANVILKDVVLALHGDELIRYEDGVSWADSHAVELNAESSSLSTKIIKIE